ncbi:MAG: hypothetical protein ACXVC3_20095 [Bdellovibrio sp.]
MKSKSAAKKASPSTQAKKKAPSKKKAPAKKATKSSLVRARPVEKATVETTLETPREPAREIEPSTLTAQPKMKLPRKNERSFREQQQSAAKPNSVNPASRK